jgi:thymidylate synthase
MSAFPAQSAAMRPYLDFMRHVRDHGLHKDDRTGTGTLSVFGYQMRFDLGAGFPLLTTKKYTIHRSRASLVLVGTPTALPARERRNYGDEWADEHGDLGPSTGASGALARPDGRRIDQLSEVVAQIVRTDSRR